MVKIERADSGVEQAEADAGEIVGRVGGRGDRLGVSALGRRLDGAREPLGVSRLIGDLGLFAVLSFPSPNNPMFLVDERGQCVGEDNLGGAHHRPRVSSSS